ncbi:MAG: hypothetical protein KF770_19055 [Anaerolineae bacterium]|nr:hypothetical protein [Anaerolineae bacterium]
MSKTKSLIGFLFLGLLIVMFIYGLGQQAQATQQQPGYPGPDTVIEQPDPYPAPPSTSSDQQNACTAVGEWVTYTDTVAGYSLQYPAESELKESPSTNETYRSISIYLKPACYGQTCSGSNRVIVSVLQNPERLSMEQFVEQEFHLDSTPPHKDSVQSFQTSKSLVEIAGTQALRIEDGVTFDQPDVFIPHDDQVIRVYVGADSPMPPHGPPCKQTLELFNEILASVELFTP